MLSKHTYSMTFINTLFNKHLNFLIISFIGYIMYFQLIFK